jgi:hypothetical protein
MKCPGTVLYGYLVSLRAVWDMVDAELYITL